jgi:hypothetical protein
MWARSFLAELREPTARAIPHLGTQREWEQDANGWPGDGSAAIH